MESIKEQLSEFGSELEHVEHHITEFAAFLSLKPGDPRDVVGKSLSDVESALDGMLRQVGLRKKDAHDHDHGKEGHESQGISTNQLAVNLKTKISDFGTAMSHNDKNSPEFLEAYKEA